MSVLTQDQKNFLQLFSKEKDLMSNFYFTGGTALAEYYIPYRYSDDLDFFSETEISPQDILISLKKFKTELKYEQIEFNTSFNRNLFFIQFSDYLLKTEFTYFPFPQIQPTKTKEGMMIDSPIDLAVNKLLTIYQNPRSRDFMDLFMLIEKYGFDIKELILKTRSKFDVHIDLIKLGTQFMLCTVLKDFPKLIKPLDENTWQTYFLTLAKNLKSQIF